MPASPSEDRVANPSSARAFVLRSPGVCTFGFRLVQVLAGGDVSRDPDAGPVSSAIGRPDLCLKFRWLVIPPPVSGQPGHVEVFAIASFSGGELPPGMPGELLALLRLAFPRHVFTAISSLPELLFATRVASRKAAWCCSLAPSGGSREPRLGFGASTTGTEGESTTLRMLPDPTDGDPGRALLMLSSLPAATVVEWSLESARLDRRETKAIERTTGRPLAHHEDSLLDCRLVVRGTAGSAPSLMCPAIARALGFRSATLSLVDAGSISNRFANVLLTPDSLINVVPPPDVVAALAPIFRSALRPRLPQVPLPSDGLLLGRAADGRAVRQTLEDRMRHRAIIGASGTGKTCLMTADALGAAESGHGLMFLDPHADAFQRIRRCLPANRREDLTVLDISAAPVRGVALNLLECKDVSQIPIRAGQVVELIATQGDPAFFGPMFRQAAFNGAAVLAARMEEPGTLADIPRLFLDPRFRNDWLADPVVAERAPDAVRWWTEGFSRYSDFTRSEHMDYYISKFNLFATDRVLRSILGSSRSTIDLRDAMDHRGILLCNFGRGGANPLASSLLTAVFMQAVFNAALSRSDVAPSQRPPYFVYCDEFQLVAGASTGAMLGEIRKYAVSLNFALQFLDALPSETLAAVIGTVATKVLFRLGARDAARMVEFMPDLTVKELVRLPNFVAVVDLLAGGAPMAPFTVFTPRPNDHRNGEALP